MRRRLLSLVLAVAAWSVPIQAQLGRIIPGRTPCDLASGGCSAAWSVNRRVRQVYTGPLWQMTRTGGATQDIDQLPTGLVDMATISSFCTVTCYYNKLYDQSGNGNDLTITRGFEQYSTDGQGRPRVAIVYGGNGYFNNASPTNVPIGNTDKTVIGVFDDTVRPTCCGVFGMAHAITDGFPPATDFLIGPFGPEAAYGIRNSISMLIDGETTVGELQYIPSHATCCHGTFNGLGLVIYWGSYTASGTAFTMQVDQGVPVTVTSSLPLESHLTQLRLGAGGDGSDENAIWYEGEIFSSVLPASTRSLITSNTQNFYGLARQPSCGPAPRQLTPGELLGSNASALVGPWLMNAQYRGPILAIQRASDNTYLDVGSVGCDLDVASATAFCNGTACTVTTRYNQTWGNNYVQQGLAQTSYPPTAWPIIWDFDSTAYFLAGTPSPTAPPALTFNAIGSHPCLTYSAATPNALRQDTAVMPAAAPLGVFTVATNTGNFSAANTLFSVTTTAQPQLSFGNPSGTVTFAGNSGSINTSTTNVFHGVTGIVTDSTHLALYIESAQTTGTATNTTIANYAWFGLDGPSGTHGFTGQECGTVVFNTPISSGLVATLAAAIKAFLGY